jgi:hypothetical protein
MNTEKRELDISELDAVSGGSALTKAIIQAKDVIRRIDKLLNEPDEPAPYVPMKL